jgi:hypothetical protein
VQTSKGDKMDNWLAQFIRETQTTYPDTNQHPIHVMRHLLFIVGNGYEYSTEGGNFVVPIAYSRSIPFHIFYSENTTIEYLRDFANNDYDVDDKIEENVAARYNHLSDLYTKVDHKFDPKKLGEMLWREERAKFYGRYDNQVTLLNPDEFDPEDTLYNVEYWVKQINETDITLSEHDFSNYAKVCQFDMNTDIVLRRTAKAILGAFYLIAHKENNTYIMGRIRRTLSNFITGTDTINE